MEYYYVLIIKNENYVLIIKNEKIFKIKKGGGKSI